MSAPISFQFPPELVDAIAERVADLLADRSRPRNSPYLTVDETADYLRCSKQAVYDRVHQGALTPCRDGRRLLFPVAELDAYLGARS
jgi:excisionase family DNA binding protein